MLITSLTGFDRRLVKVACRSGIFREWRRLSVHQPASVYLVDVRYREVKVAGDWTAAVSQLTRLLLFLARVQYIYTVHLLKESYHHDCYHVELQLRQLFKCTIRNGLPFKKKKK